MCGIIGLFNINDEQEMRSEALKMARTIRHRGPDWSGSYSDEYCVLMHERLSIVDVEHGSQPLFDTKNKRVLAEIEKNTHGIILSADAGYVLFEVELLFTF